MITEAIFGWMVDLFVKLLPTLPPVPAMFSDLIPSAMLLLEQASQFSAWVPFELVGVVVVAYIASLITAFGLRLARIVISYLTLGGGMGA